MRPGLLFLHAEVSGTELHRPAVEQYPRRLDHAGGRGGHFARALQYRCAVLRFGEHAGVPGGSGRDRAAPHAGERPLPSPRPEQRHPQAQPPGRQIRRQYVRIHILKGNK